MAQALAWPEVAFVSHYFWAAGSLSHRVFRFFSAAMRARSSCALSEEKLRLSCFLSSAGGTAARIRDNLQGW